MQFSWSKHSKFCKENVCENVLFLVYANKDDAVDYPLQKQDRRIINVVFEISNKKCMLQKSFFFL